MDSNQTKPPFSARTARELEPNALAQALDAARAEGRVVLDLTVSNPTCAEIPYDGARILSALADPRALRYAPLPLGMLSAREAVAQSVARATGVAVAPSNILLSASTSEAYAFLMKLFCDPGDEILVPAPSYPLFDLLATFESVRLVSYRLAYDGAWHVDLDALRHAVTPRTRAIFMVTPNNPTGSYVKASELEAMAELGIPIVSDEVFAAYPLEAPASRVPTALMAGVGQQTLVFALGGLSKAAALPQMKLAWTCVAGPPSLVHAAMARLELIGDSFLSAGTPVQTALPALLACGDVAAKAIRDRTRHNLVMVRSEIGAGSAATVLHVEGGWYAILRLPRVRSEEAWALGLLQERDVYVHPGHFFGFEGEAYVVVSLLTPETTFAEGIRRIARYVG
jgi:aspartate/methionine/tyrosine aminotransferase